jgi:PAS domain S-box-containing protein
MSSSSDSGSPHAGSVRFKRLRLAVGLLGALAILAFDGLSAYDAWLSHRRALIATDREISNVARALAEQTAWTWQAVDLLLRDTARWYAAASREAPPESLDEGLAIRTAGVRPVRLVTIVDARGFQRHRSRGSSPPDLTVSDRSYFIAERDHPETGPYISEPIITRSENRAGVVLARRLEDDKGGFAGVVTAIVDLDDLERFYQAVNLGRGSATHLLREDGTLLVRNPPVPNTIGQRFPELANTALPPATQLVSPIDGKRAFIAVAHVTDTPLELTITREEAVALRPWRDEGLRLGLRALIVTALGALAIAALLRQLKRVESGERALRESEERYALAMEAANEGHWDWDIASDRLFLSPKMKTLEGRSQHSVTTTRAEWRAQTIIHPSDAPRMEAALADHFEGRTPRYECEYRIRQSSGQWCWVLARGRCLRDATGKPYRFVGSAIDISAQRQAQLEKEQLEAQLRQSQKMEAVGTLAGGIAHDFNNILGAILGYGELAHQHAQEGSALRRYVDNVMHAAGRAKALVDRILGFSRSGLGEREPVNVQAVVEETLELLQASLPATIRLETRLDAGDAAVIGDATNLHQVAMNLCTNAVQAMPRGGALSVSLERVEASERRVHLRGKALPPGPYVRLVVSDTGSGIPPHVFERMFDPFFTTKSVGEGTGLGLSLVHGIVTDLGGAIDVNTRLNEGTSFEIWLPVAGETGRPETEAVREVPHGAGETVMIVDDEPLLVSLTEELLAGLGYEPAGFASSRAALQAFRANPQRFDLILTDEAMPDLIGTELAREVRLVRPSIPIILMSGHGGAPLATRAAAIGIDAVLHKPLQRHDLAESLARVLRDSQSIPVCES